MFIIPALLGIIAGLLFDNFAIGVVVFFVFFIPTIIRIYVPYAKDNPEKLWFKRKLYGWGWTPVTWQGWLVTVVYVALIVAFFLTIDETSPSREVALTFVLPALIITAAFIRIAYKKGEKPRWQWGGRGK